MADCILEQLSAPAKKIFYFSDMFSEIDYYTFFNPLGLKTANLQIKFYYLNIPED